MENFKTIFILGFCLSYIQVSFTQINWEKYKDNPVFTDTTGGWTIEGAQNPTILIIDNVYHMWYSGFDGTYGRIGYATSLDGFSWEPYANNPVLDVGLENSWESTFVLSPSVIYDGSTFHMWYEGINSTISPWIVAIGYATSPDGIDWTKYSDQPVLEKGPSGSWDDTEVFGPSVLYDGSKYHMWYAGGSTGSIRNCGYATSIDGISWDRYKDNPVLRVGKFGNWDYPKTSQPRVIFDGAKYHMFYSGGEFWNWSMGYATSQDKTTWTKHSIDIPIMGVGETGSWDDNHVGVPSVIIDTTNSIFHMWYSGGSQYPDVHVGYAHSHITGIGNNILNNIPSVFILSQNHPNPFNPSTTIDFTLPISEFTILKIYNILGKEVTTLVSNKLNQGSHTYQFDGENLASGVYYYQLVAGGYREVKKMILLR